MTDKLLDITAVAELLGLSRNTVLCSEKRKPDFPMADIKLSQKRQFWYEQTILDYMKYRTRKQTQSRRLASSDMSGL